MLARKWNVKNGSGYVYFMYLGMMTIAISLVLQHFFVNIGWVDFLAGILTGMSVVFNFTGLFYYGRLRRQREEQSKKTSEGLE